MKTYAGTIRGSHFASTKVKLTMFLKIFCYLIIFTAAGSFFSSCSTGYVATEPRYDLEYARPLQPSQSHIWINGDWRWNRRSHLYIYDHGYWALPRNGYIYRDGYWETDQRGKWWRKGYWEKERRDKAYNRSRKNNRDRDRGKLYENRK